MLVIIIKNKKLSTNFFVVIQHRQIVDYYMKAER